MSGEKYVSVDLQNQTLTFYNLNHTFYKSISYSSVPLLGLISPAQEKHNASILYISENLFDTDSEIEFMYTYNYTPPNNPSSTTQIINEDGTILFSVNNEAPIIAKPTYHNQYYPIYNTSAGTKMILSKTDSSAKVYGLAGVLTEMIKHNNVISESSLLLSPNPSGKYNQIAVEYKLPSDIKIADLIIYNNLGTEIKKYQIGGDMGKILIDPNEFISGIYYYSIISNSKIISTKKSIVIE